MINCLRREWKLLVLALGFLTRLAPARQATEQELVDSVKYYPATGFILGCILAAPFILGFGNGRPWIQAFLYLCLSLWLTRGLHMDGLSDLADAWGSLRSGERFWKILKDSRIGAFGCLAIALAVAGTLIGARETLAAGSPLALIMPSMLARSAALLFMALTPVAEASTLAKLLASGSGARQASIWLGLTLIAGIVCSGLIPSIAALAAAILLVFGLRRTALKAGGMNGDFIGALIVLSETAALFCFALF